MCIEEGTLRAKLDGELTEAETLAVEDHLASCAECRGRAEAIAARANRIGALFSVLEPATAGQADSVAALARLRSRTPSRRFSFPRYLVPAWGALAAVIVCIVVLTSAPTRAWAQKLLGLLRIRNVAVVTIDRSFLQEGKGQQLGQLLSDEVKVTKDERAQNSANREEASLLAGFAVRLPSSRYDSPRLSVQGEHAFQLTVNLERVQTFLNIVGRPDLRFPDSLNGATVAVSIPRAVVADYGDCPKAGQCTSLVEAPAPTVVTSPELNIAPIAEVALQVAGMSAEEARAFSQTIDWTSTLVVAIPRDSASYENVAVDGVKGFLVIRRTAGTEPPGHFLFWMKNGIIYSIRAYGNPALTVALGDSLQ